MSLLFLVKNNNIDGVRDFLLNENINVNENAALIHASEYNYIEIVKLLLEVEDINVNIQDYVLDTALTCASYNNYIEIVKLLLEVKNINVNLQDSDGDNALICAFREKNAEIIKLLLTNETININLQNYDGDTALIYTSLNGNIEVVKLLLNIENINVNLENNCGITAMMHASENGRIEIVKLLLSKGATVSVKYDYSDDINEVLTNWKTYLPRWNRFKTYKYYPKEFNEIVMLWLLICKRKNFVSKDIKLLMIEYLAESWKLN